MVSVSDEGHVVVEAAIDYIVECSARLCSECRGLTATCTLRERAATIRAHITKQDATIVTLEELLRDRESDLEFEYARAERLQAKDADMSEGYADPDRQAAQRDAVGAGDEMDDAAYAEYLDRAEDAASDEYWLAGIRESRRREARRVAAVKEACGSDGDA